MKIIKLTKGYETIVDDDDYDKFGHLKWFADVKRKTTVYAAHGGKDGKTEYLHRLIMNTPKNLFVDHINHNGLDNRKINLRNCTLQQNAFNQRKHKVNISGYRGVTWKESAKKWNANIYVNQKCINLGYYKDPKEAAEVYNKAAIKHYGKFACLNKIASS